MYSNLSKKNFENSTILHYTFYLHPRCRGPHMAHKTVQACYIKIQIDLAFFLLLKALIGLASPDDYVTEELYSGRENGGQHVISKRMLSSSSIPTLSSSTPRSSSLPTPSASSDKSNESSTTSDEDFESTSVEDIESKSDEVIESKSDVDIESAPSSLSFAEKKIAAFK